MRLRTDSSPGVRLRRATTSRTRATRRIATSRTCARGQWRGARLAGLGPPEGRQAPLHRCCPWAPATPLLAARGPRPRSRHRCSLVRPWVPRMCTHPWVLRMFLLSSATQMLPPVGTGSAPAGGVVVAPSGLLRWPLSPGAVCGLGRPSVHSLGWICDSCCLLLCTAVDVWDCCRVVSAACGYWHLVRFGRSGVDPLARCFLFYTVMLLPLVGMNCLVQSVGVHDLSLIPACVRWESLFGR